ncbi:hypothetical protein PPACK8108_LOCUS20927 [Phakopsora pachyrhizi]|uniref:Uncharacterized protein n=1 Tax=Phakopsora pachyrhizi TaxID=170000 RepID=A0AAV0BH89_PHAPC|nr:hypothetical protein PPACK8108_LOCUS20927 [Phakopsora pachyrhizi]
MKLVNPLSNVRRNKWIPIAEGVKGKRKKIVQDSIDLTGNEDDDDEEEGEDLIQQYSELSPGQQSNYPSQSFYNHKFFLNRATEDDDAEPMNLKWRKFPSDGPNKNQEIQTDRPLRKRRSPKLKGPLPEHLKRGRKSKSNAIITLSSHSPSSPRQTRPNQERIYQRKEPKAHPGQHPSRVNITQKLGSFDDGKLDFSSIRTESPRSNPRARQKGRLFELEHCPIFYPIPDEFKDLIKYFELIGSRLKSHGVGKAVPPLRWRLPFVLDTEQFKFKTRLQHLNSMEASARANTNFMEQLYLFHKQQGNSAAVVTNGSKLQVPVINYQPVDLWKLRKQINEMGGYDNDECLGKRKKTGWIGINYIDLDVEDYLLCVELTY